VTGYSAIVMVTALRQFGWIALALGSSALMAEMPSPAAERALRAGDCRAASEALALEAALERDPRKIERALDIATACHHQGAAWQLAERLLALDSENVETLQRVGLVALETWKIPQARRIFADLLQKPDVEPARALADILPPLAEGAIAAAAWQVFGGLVERETATPQILATLARMACNSDDLAQCRALLAAARDQGGGRDVRSIRLAAAAAAAAGDTTVALDEASLLVLGDPANHRFVRIETLVTLDRIEEARAELQQIEAATDDAPDAAFKREADRRLALLALSRGELPEAQRRFSARLSAERGAAEALFYLAVIAEREGRNAAALQAYQQLIAAGAGLTPRSRAARLLATEGLMDEALKLFEDLRSTGRREVIEIEIAQSRALFDAGLTKLAIESIDAALARHPRHADLLYQKAVLQDGSGQSRAGIKTFETLLTLRPDEANVMNALGYTLADRKQQLARAEKLIRAALEQRPDNAAYLDSLGWVRYRRGDLQAAEPLLARAWRLSKEAEIAAHWGEVLWVSGDRAAARRVWAEALVVAPDAKPLRRVIERFVGPE